MISRVRSRTERRHAPKPLTFTASGDKQTTVFHVSGSFTLSWAVDAQADSSYEGPAGSTGPIARDACH